MYFGQIEIILEILIDLKQQRFNLFLYGVMQTGFDCPEAAVIKGCRSDLWKINGRNVCLDEPTGAVRVFLDLQVLTIVIIPHESKEITKKTQTLTLSEIER